MNKSESIKELATALAKAQSEMKNPAFDSSNPHYRNKYASLASVRDSVIPTLAKHGIACVQFLQSTDSGVSCETMLTHQSGEWMSATLDMPATKKDAQGYGSAATYARRYALMAVAGVVGDEDDDGNAAVAGNGKSVKATPTMGTWEAMTPEKQTILLAIADDVRRHLVAGDPVEAYYALESNQLETEEKIALWTRFDSKERSALKKVSQQEKAA